MLRMRQETSPPPWQGRPLSGCKASSRGKGRLTPHGVIGKLPGLMADVKVRNLDENVVRALRTRAKARRLSMEEEVRRSLAESIAVKQDAFARRAAACR